MREYPDALPSNSEQAVLERNREKARRWRRNNIDKARAYENAYQRALYRLRDNHRDEFLRLVNEERGE